MTELVKFIEHEIEFMKKCTECYFNWYIKRNWFSTVCNRPHCVVWAKVAGHIYWPGKAMSVNNDQVHVRFFGVHNFADVPANKCYLYSVESPDQQMTKKNQRRNSTIQPPVARKPSYQAALNVSMTHLF